MIERKVEAIFREETIHGKRTMYSHSCLSAKNADVTLTKIEWKAYDLVRKETMQTMKAL